MLRSYLEPEEKYLLKYRLPVQLEINRLEIENHYTGSKFTEEKIEIIKRIVVVTLNQARSWVNARADI